MQNIDFNAISRVSDLLNGYLFNRLNDQELDELQLWINASPANREVFESVVNEDALVSGGRIYLKADTQEALLTVKKQIEFTEKSRFNLETSNWLWMKVAASIVVVLASIIYFFHPAPSNHLENQIAIGRNVATIIESNGNTILLSDEKPGVVVKGSVLKYTDGTPIEKPVPGTGPNQNGTAEQVIQTPVGGTYQLILADGTKVWLNAATSLKFTTSFTGLKKRLVTLLGGEAYFEVSKNEQQPFNIVSKGQEIEVLGTKFNVSTYGDNMETSLVEGAIRLTNKLSGQQVSLRPGLQALVNGKEMRLQEVNTGRVTAWQRGDFEFKDAGIKEVMNTLARWYAIDVVYQGSITAEKFNGKIARNKNIAEVLSMLEGTKAVRFQITGKMVTVR